MSRVADDLLAHARALTRQERARVLRGLIDSLDEDREDADAETAWAAEIVKRVSEVRSGKCVREETGELFARLEDELTSMPHEGAQKARSSRGRPEAGRKMVRGGGSRARSRIR